MAPDRVGVSNGDSDCAETEEWLESLDAVLQHGGPDRARFLLTQLKNKAVRSGVEIPFTANTPYINTIPANRQPPYPGSREITLALERGEVQGACGIGWTGIETMHPEWFAKDTIRVLVQLSNKGHDDLNRRGVPRVSISVEYTGTPGPKGPRSAKLRLAFAASATKRPFFVPMVSITRSANSAS